MTPRPLELGPVPAGERRAGVPRRLLALSGGGYRGLFTARVLEHLEAASGRPVRDSFDLIAGTSIGGILAIGLAAGAPARTLRLAFERDGATIFRRRWRRAFGLFGARYDPGGLRATAAGLLGAGALTPFAELPAALAVVAIDERAGAPKVFRTRALSRDLCDAVPVLDVALATSAAPTFFPPHAVDGRTYVDGGLVANAPELVAASEAIRQFGARPDDLGVLAIGTAGSPRQGRATGDPGAAAWLLRHGLVELTIDAQARLAAEHLRALGPGRLLRIDATPRTPLPLDGVGPAARTALLDLADAAFAEARARQPADLRYFSGRR